MLLSCTNISYSYITENTLKDINFHINEGEQTAIVGVNGAGKTTLFRILTGQLTPDTGQIFTKSGISIGYLSQHGDFQSHKTIYQELYESDQDILKLKAILQDYEARLGDTSNPSENLLHSYHEAMETYKDAGGYAYDSLVKGVIKGLGFDDNQSNQVIDTLSGGQKTRVSLGKLLIRQPDLLLLDEPTNHLDLASIKWLEGFLNAYKGTLLMISHDRYFLDKLVSKVIDIERGKSIVYKGNYSEFIKKKEFQTYIDTKHYEEQQNEIKRQEEIVKRLRSYRDEKFIKRAVSREKALDKMEILDKPQELQASMNLQLNPKKESGHDVLRVKGLSMAFGPKKLFTDIDFDVYKEDRIALVGNNGTGKTSLFRILMEDLKASSGTFALGSSVEMAYYDQEHENLDSNLTMIEEIADVFPNMTITEIRNLLAAFLFTGDDVFKEIGSLSGGEKGRLSLAKLMLSGGNFLLLDEPTNHLDMISKEILENALLHYTGTIFFISHDRYFINRIATKVLELHDETVTLYHGNYDYYEEKKLSSLDQETQVKTDTQNKLDWQAQKELDKKKRKLENLLKETEEAIEAKEIRIETIDQELLKEEVYSDYTLSQELIEEKSQLEETIESLYDQWQTHHNQLEAL